MKPISYGERGRIGLIYPNTGWVMEPEFYALAPEGVATVTTRVLLGDVTAENIKNLADKIEDAAMLLGDAKSDLIVLGCTSGSFICGKGYDQEIIAKIKAAAPGVLATTTATAVIHAIQAFGATKIAVGTPYLDEINQQARLFLQAHDLEILNFKGLGLRYDYEINGLTREEIKTLIRQTDTPEAEMVVLLCTSIKGVDLLDEMEQELGKPIITAIQATFWECMNLLDLRGEVSQGGSLFRR